MLLLGFPKKYHFSAFLVTEKQRWVCVCIDMHMKTVLNKYLSVLQAQALRQEEMLTLKCLCKQFSSSPSNFCDNYMIPNYVFDSISTFFPQEG